MTAHRCPKVKFVHATLHSTKAPETGNPEEFFGPRAQSAL